LDYKSALAAGLPIGSGEISQDEVREYKRRWELECSKSRDTVSNEGEGEEDNGDDSE